MLYVKGHFAQVVWRNSRCFGIGKARSRTGKIVVVAHYTPAGNISGLFQTNVLPPLLHEDGVSTPHYIVSSEETESGSTNTTNSST